MIEQLAKLVEMWRKNAADIEEDGHAEDDGAVATLRSSATELERVMHGETAE